MQNRNIGLDILRIILAFLVIGIHVLAPATGGVNMCVELSITKVFSIGLTAICYPAVNTYVILSGFFAFAHKKTLYQVSQNLGKLWLCLIFFSLLGLGVGALYTQQMPTITTVVSRLFPICSGEWWYMTNYCVLMIISPMLNKLIEQYPSKSHLYALCGALFVCTIIPFFLKYNDALGINIGYGLIWFVILYCTGAYLYRKKDDIAKVTTPIKYLTGFIVMVILFLAMNMFLGKFEITKGFGFGAYNSILVYLEAVLLFCTFYTLNIRSLTLSKYIVYLGGLSLASYIFHCQSDFGPMIWQITQPSKYANSLLLIPVTLAIMLGVFTIATLLEIGRRWIFSKISAERWVINTINNFFHKDLL